MARKAHADQVEQARPRQAPEVKGVTLLPEGWYSGTIKSVAIVQGHRFRSTELREQLRVEVELWGEDGPAKAFYYVNYFAQPHERSRLAELFRVCLGPDCLGDGNVPPIEALIGGEAEWQVVHRAGTSRLTGRPAVFVRVQEVRQPGGAQGAAEDESA